MEQNGPLLLDVTAAGLRLGIPRTRVYAMIREGQITPIRIGGRTFISDDECRRFVRDLQHHATVRAAEARTAGALS